MWILLSAASALVLGVYDLSKKSAVAGNPVLPTLFSTTFTGAACTAPILLLSALRPGLAERLHLYVAPQPAAMHLLILAKSLIVGFSWALSYAALKRLPVTVASPLRATAPLFTVLGAVVVFGERPAPWQWAGISLILAAYLAYSLPSRGSGSPAPRTWMGVMLLAALAGSVSAGFDKHLLQSRGLPALFVLGWFLPYLAAMLGAALLASRLVRRGPAAPFRLRPSLLLVGPLLVVADLAYFAALSDPAAKLSVVSAVRRTNVVVSFLGGMLVFREGNAARRLLPLAGIIGGLVLLLFGRG